MSVGSPTRTAAPGHTETLRVVPGAPELRPDAYARRRRSEAVVLGIATPILLIVLWQIAAMADWIDTRFFPAPSRILEAGVNSWQQGQLQSDFWATTIPLLIGIGCGFLVGCLVGFAMGLTRWLRLALDPILSALYTVPKLAILPLLLLIFGLGPLPKVILIALGVFFIVWISVTEAVAGMPEAYVETARSFRVSPAKTFFRVVFPEALPAIFVSLRIAVGSAVLIAVGIEFVNATSGLGFRIWNSWQLFLADRMYVCIVVVAVLGYALRLLTDLLARICVPWAAKSEGARG